ncbi:MAG TPA: hypothetical protein VNT79_01560 [Phycisphaerae bacterium]|nr:hypothetical protein [Phycisphaerae bacterium]
MDEQSLEKTLSELLQTVGTSNEAPEIAAAVKTSTSSDHLEQAVDSLQDSLDYLRLTVKYLVFDLEATRRENAHLRKMLEEDSGNQSSQ